MQNTSIAYKEAMQSTFRDRAYMRVTLGAVNHRAQSSGTVTGKGEAAWFSSDDIIAYSARQESYAGMDCCSASGQQILLPEIGSALDTGLISANPVGNGSYNIDVGFSEMLDVKGLTLNFDRFSYPKHIEVIVNGVVHSYENDSSEFTTEDTFNAMESMTLRFSDMHPETSRLRLKHITFGYGLMYTNEDIIDSSWRVYTSEIAEDMPQVDFSVTLKNYDQYFDPDNPESVINYFDTNMPIQVEYGMTLQDGTVEWFQAASCYISEWSADNARATISGNDILRTMESVYRYGKYYESGITLYQLAKDVFDDAGIEDYYIDPYLKNLTTKNPLPVVSHKECIQIIANASKCMFSVSRSGGVQLMSAFNSDIGIRSTHAAEYANLANVLNEAPKQRYAAMYTDYTPVSVDNQTRLPGGSIFAGYVSDNVSESNCKFASNPSITLTQEAASHRTGLTIRFGIVTPKKMRIETYHDGNMVEYFQLTGMTQEYSLPYTFKPFTELTITFLETEKPYQPIDVEYISMAYVNDFRITRLDMMSHPTVTNERMVKQIDVSTTFFEKSEVDEDIFSEIVVMTAGQEMDIDLTVPHFDYSAIYEDETPCEILTSGAYFVRVRFNRTGRYSFTIRAKEYRRVTSTYSHPVQYRGEIKRWNNPLISDTGMAQSVAEWLGNYYANSISYTYDTRGNPELDATDVIYQDNPYRDDMKVRIQEQNVRFNGAYSGKLVTRRMRS